MLRRPRCVIIVQSCPNTPLTQSSARNAVPPKGASPFPPSTTGAHIRRTRSYVESLENRLEKMEKLLQTVRNPFHSLSAAFDTLYSLSYVQMQTSHRNSAVRLTRKAGTRIV